MQHYKVNILKKFFGIIALLTLLFTSSILSADPIRIMPLGDSITRGDSGNLGSGYRGPLWSKLVNAGYNFDFVGTQSNGQNYNVSFDPDHEGHNGDEADLIANAVNGYLTNAPADIVLLHIGTNDISFSGDNSDQTVKDVEEILNNIDNYSKDIKVILARIINRNPHNAETTSFNTKLEIMAQQRIANGDDILIVDMENSADINYTTDMSDTLHPNDTGYNKMADLWYSALKTTIPMHHWKLDEPMDSITYLDSNREANGTCIGVGCPKAVPGKINGAQEFDGSNEINITDTATFNWDANDSFTIEFWMKTNTDNTGGKNNIMMGQRSNSNATGLAWFIGVKNNDGRIFVGQNDSNDTGYTDTLGNNIIVNDGKWHHVAYVRDGDSNISKIYVDGILDDTLNHTYDAPLNDGNQPVTFGYLDWNGYKYTGSLDEITIYDSALNAAQILQNYHAGQITIISTPVTFAEVNVAYSYNVNTNNDPDATFWLNTYPNGMDININSGEIGWTANASDVGNIDIEVEASDINNGDTAIQDYVLRVRNTALFPSGMNHYWKLDEEDGSTTYLDYYWGADGTCIGVGCPVATIAGAINGAQEFDGSHKINVTETSTFNWAADSSFTIEFWMKTDTNNTGGKHNIMMGQRSNSNSTGLAWYIGVTSTTGKIRLGLNDSNDTGYTDSFGENIIVSDNQWHHIAYVRNGDSNTTKIYVDGILDDTLNHTYDAPLNDGNQPVTFGYLDWGGFRYTGLLDEIVVFDSALSQIEIQEHVTNGLNGIEFGADVIPPVITRLGSNVSIELGTPYIDAGSTASDNIDGDITANIVTENPVNINAEGIYTVTYDVNDSAGNQATQVTRTVTVTADVTPPVITRLGANPQVIVAGSSYTELNATAQDTIDGDISANIVIDASAVDTSTPGQYTVTYDVNDSAGNPATQVTRTVNVVDTNVPVITFLGANPQVIVVGSTYIELNATAQDDVDGDISANIVIDASAVDTSTPGQYTVTYDVNDSSGNTALQVTRTVNVVNEPISSVSTGGGCSYNPDSKNFDMSFLLMMALGLFYPFRRRFIKQSSL